MDRRDAEREREHTDVSLGRERARTDDELVARSESAGETADEVIQLALGRCIARAIVDAHGGTIAVDSAPGAGATFRVRLPA